MKEIIIIPGNPITKKNSGVITVNRGTGRPMLIPSPQYRAYEKACGWAIKFAYDGSPIDYPVNVQCVYYMATARRVDLTNLLEASHDILVKYGVLADDNSKIIVSVDGSRVYVDRKNPRVEITITKTVVEI